MVGQNLQLEQSLYTGCDMSIETLPRRCLINLRGSLDSSVFVQQVRAAAGCTPPKDPLRSTVGDLASILWLGPDWWLLTASSDNAPRIHAALEPLVNDPGSSVLEVSDALNVIRIRGNQAREFLALSGTLDFHERAFPVGKAVRARFARNVGIYHLVQDAPALFDLYIPASYIGYALVWLERNQVSQMPGSNIGGTN